MTHIAFNEVFFLHKRKFFTLFILWLFGLFIGCNLFYTCSFSFLSLMGSVVMQPVSIVGLLASMLIPFIISYLSIITNNSIYVLIVVFLKSISFGFTCTLLEDQYLSAGWLLRFLFLFSDYCFFPACCWFHLLGLEDKSRIRSSLIIILLFAVVVIMVNFSIISPLLQSLF